ncbi:MAG: hypothetical protein IJS75_02650, partial [Bacteroidales bacterium]|nr:hypothetical protein [Bacteroidales bacterium]
FPDSRVRKHSYLFVFFSIYKDMNAFSYPSKRGINFAKIRGFKVTDYTLRLQNPGASAASMLRISLTLRHGG